MVAMTPGIWSLVGKAALSSQRANVFAETANHRPSSAYVM